MRDELVCRIIAGIGAGEIRVSYHEFRELSVTFGAGGPWNPKVTETLVHVPIVVTDQEWP